MPGVYPPLRHHTSRGSNAKLKKFREVDNCFFNISHIIAMKIFNEYITAEGGI